MKLNYRATKKIKAIALLSAMLFTIGSAYSQNKPWPVPSASSIVKNPLPVDANTIKNGRTLYVSYCSPCHGASGKGDGAAAAALTTKPANHTSAAIQAESDGSLYYKITQGRSPMPPYKVTLTESQRWALVSYIKTLGKK
ncbi:MAG: c-type cytochrome [Flavisolibacter sp.]